MLRKGDHGERDFDRNKNTGVDVRLKGAGLKTRKIGEKRISEMSTSWHFWIRVR
jgi:hypothetical protein